MMGVIGDPAYGQLLVAHDERATLWAAETTATSSGKMPGRLASLTSAMALACAGSPDLADGSTIQCLRSGYPSAGATVGYYDADDNLIGWDAPTSASHVEVVDWSSRSGSDDNLTTATTTSEDEIVYASQYDSTTGQVSIRVRVRDVAGTWSSPTTLATFPEAANVYPHVIATDDRVRLYYWAPTYDSSGTYGNRALVALEALATDDLTDADSWVEMGRDGAALIDSATTPGRVIVLEGSGQWMAIYRSSTSVLQLASVDGLTWASVGSSITASDFTAIWQGGAFILLHTDSDGVLYARSVGSAYSSLSSVTPVTINDYGSTTGSALDAYVDGGGTGWVMTGGLGGLYAEQWSTDDGGASWRGSGNNGRIYTASNLVTAQSIIVNGTPTWWRDRLIMVHEVSPDSTTTSAPNAALIATHFGRCTSLPLPTSQRGWRPADRFAYPFSWWPGIHIITTWDTVTGTVALDPHATEPAMAIDVDTSSLYNFEIPGGSVNVNLARIVGEANSGTAALRVQADDGTDAVRLKVEFSTTGLAIYDDVAGGAALQTVSNSGVLDVIVEVNFDTGAWLVWYAERTADVPVYSYLSGSGLTEETLADDPTYFRVLASSQFDLYQLQGRNYVSSVNDRDVGRGYAGYPGAEAINGRPVSGWPVWVGEGLYVSASGGLARAGDTWTYTADAQYHVRQAGWTPTYPSPRTRWRSTVTTEESVAWWYDGQTVATLSPVWALVFEGTAQRLSLAFHDGSSWGSDTSIDVGLTRTMTRAGSTLTPTGTAETGAFVDEDELVGGFAVDASGNARRILANTAGTLGSVTGLTWRKALLTIDDPGSTDAGSASWSILWPRVAYVFAPPATAKGFRVRFGVSASLRESPEGYHDAKLLIGPGYYLGLKPGTDATRTWEAAPRTFEGSDRMRWTGKAAPQRQVVTMTWQNTLDRLAQARGTWVGGPDYEAAWSSGDPAFARGSTSPTLSGVIPRWAASGVPVAYIPSYDRSGAEKLLTSRAKGVVVGTVDPTWTTEHVGRQDEYRTDVLRLGSVRLTELV